MLGTEHPLEAHRNQDQKPSGASVRTAEFKHGQSAPGRGLGPRRLFRYTPARADSRYVRHMFLSANNDVMHDAFTGG